MTTLAIQLQVNAPAAWYSLAMVMAAPLLGAALIVVLKPGAAKAHRDAALGTSLAALLIGAAVVAIHLLAPGRLAAPEPWTLPLFPGIESTFALGLDGISVWLVALTVVLMPLAILGSYRAIRTQTRAYYALMLLLEVAMLGVFCVRDLLWFYIFFEFTLVPLFFLIGIWGGPQRRLAAFKFFIYTLAGSMITLAAVLYLGMAGGFGFDQVRQFASSLPRATQLILFVALFAGLAIKVPLFPLHTWLPLAHTEAPTAGSVVLAGVLLKLGTYGFLRIGIDFLPSAALAAAPWMGGLAVAGILYGALGAWVQSDVKKLVAYSSISHLGFCMLGLFSLRPEGLVGGVLVMVNHGLSTGALFLVIGMIYERYHTRQMSALGGLGRRMPVISFFLVLFALSSLGLPGLNGFVSEFLVLLGTFVSGAPANGLPPTLGIAFAAVAALGVILSAVYLLHMVREVVFGPLTEPADSFSREPLASASGGHAETDKLPADATGREWLILAPLGLLVVLLGVWPMPLTRSIEPAANRILAHVAEATTPPATPPTAAAPDRDELAPFDEGVEHIFNPFGGGLHRRRTEDRSVQWMDRAGVPQTQPEADSP